MQTWSLFCSVFFFVVVFFLILHQASRAQILDKETEYLQYMRRKNHTHQQDIDDLKRQDAFLEQQVRALEKARSSAQLQTNYPSSDNSLYTNAKGGTISAFDGGSDSSSESKPEEPQQEETPYGGQLSHAGQGSNKTPHHFLLQFIIRTLSTIEKTLYFPFLFIVIFA